MIPGIVALVVLVLLLRLSQALTRVGSSLVVYTSQDQVYAEPILKDFEKRSGIGVRVVYDSEAVKTVGLANRLLAERANPQCDVFWSNEELRTRQLAAQRVFDETNGWIAVGYRSRRLVLNTNLVALDRAPRSLTELTNELWQGRVALAYPLFGSTSTHFHALRTYWGDAAWEQWCRALQVSRPLVVDGNSLVVRLVGKGEAAIGLTDSDDVAAGQREGYPVVALPLTSESLLIPNTIGIIRGTSRLAAAQRFRDHLRQPDVLAQLVIAQALESPAEADVSSGVLHPNWDQVLARLDDTTDRLRQIFLR